MSALMERDAKQYTLSVNQPVCPDCGSAVIRDRGPCRRPMFLEGLPLEERQLVESTTTSRLYDCQNCSLGFREPAINASDLERMYAAMPTERWQYATDNVAWTLARTWLLRRYRETEPVRVLDVGAFDGAFLRLLPDQWDRRAIEPSIAAHRDLEHAGIPCIAEFLTTPDPSHDGRFDVVTMFDVFEHLPHPRAALADVMAYLKPGGHLLLSTGNCRHWTWNYLGGDHWYCEPLQHIRFANPGYFTLFAGEGGCRVERIETHSHRPSTLAIRMKEAFETLSHYARRDRVWWRPLVSLLSKIPRLSYVRHKTMAPYTPGLRDHLFVVLQRCQ